MLVAFMGVGLVLASELHATAARREKERELLFIGHEFRNALGRYYDSTPGDGRPRYVRKQTMICPGGNDSEDRDHAHAAVGRAGREFSYRR